MKIVKYKLCDLIDEKAWNPLQVYRAERHPAMFKILISVMAPGNLQTAISNFINDETFK